jgi:hypothetical protein
MLKRKSWVFTLLLLGLGLVLVPTALATQPKEFNICFEWAPEGSPWGYCAVSEDFPLFTGCVLQDDTPGRAAHGTYVSFVYDLGNLPDPDDPAFVPRGECEYNLATYDIPGKGRPPFSGQPVLAMSGCTGELEGLHVQGKAPPFPEECMTLTYHFDPR